jgi:ABC-type lipoprotein release transport system permease subunit
VRPSDPAILAAAAVGLAATALLAAGVPAWRAARTDPMTALRTD